MAPHQVARPGWQLPAHDVLHHRCRLDARLHGEERNRAAHGRHGGTEQPDFQRAARQPRRDARVHGHRRGARRAHLQPGLAKGCGAYHEDHDERAVRHHARAVRARGHPARRHGRPGLLPAARLRQAFRPGSGQHRGRCVRRHGPGVLHAVHRCRRHADFRQLPGQGPLASWRGRAHCRRRYPRRPHGRPHHLPRLLRLWRRAWQRPWPGVHHASQRF